MSDYTTQLRFICESYAGRTAEGSVVSDVDTIIAGARDKVFDFDYPIFDENYKPELETKIINHFYTQEIGQETVGLFKQRLKTKMREIMPYYNQLYNSEKLKFNPFMNADYIDTHNQQSEGSDNLSSDQSATFTNNTNRDVSNTHEDHETSVTNRDLGRNASGDKGVQLSGDDTNTESGSIELEKEGAEMVKDTQPNNFSTLVKEADTPIGRVGGSGDIGSAVGDNSGYLSKITETVSNATSSDRRKSGYTSTSYGKYYKTEDGANEVVDKPRKDTTTFKSHKNKTDYGKREDTDYTDNVTETEDTTTKTDQNGSYKTDDDTVATGRSNTNQLDARTTKDKQDYFGKVFGKVGSETYSEMLMKFRDTFLNIDMMVIKELEPLFMLIW